MSLLESKQAQLKQIEEKLAELEKQYQDEVKPLKEKVEKLRAEVQFGEQLFEEWRQATGEALATLATKRNRDGGITDADFLEFEKAAELETGFFNDIGEPTDTESEKDVA